MITVPRLSRCRKLSRLRCSRRAGRKKSRYLRWDDLDGDRILVRDMKHPGDKKGNNVYCELPPEALAIVKSMPRDERRSSPIRPTPSAPLSRAPAEFGIEDLRFHDLRHEGISRCSRWVGLFRK